MSKDQPQQMTGTVLKRAWGAGEVRSIIWYRKDECVPSPGDNKCVGRGRRVVHSRGTWEGSWK